MTSYLLDTNVISETARTKPNATVADWIRQLPLMRLPAVTVYELAAGIKSLPVGRKRQFLDAWFAGLLAAECEILPFDRDAALVCADIEVEARRQRRVIEHRDLLILAIAKSRSFAVATRNVAHFRGVGVPVYDPFEDVYIF